MRMARLNVYVPDELAEAARAAELNVSAITQDAIRTVLDANSVDAWLDSLELPDRVSVSHAAAQRALDEARDELWGDG
jgi:post-segregation antitoxin (ccd killing protein)